MSKNANEEPYGAALRHEKHARAIANHALVDVRTARKALEQGVGVIRGNIVRARIQDAASALNIELENQK
jgi:hypothetical protein